MQLLVSHPHQSFIKYEHELKIKKKKYQYKRQHIYVENPMSEKPWWGLTYKIRVISILNTKGSLLESSLP